MSARRRPPSPRPATCSPSWSTSRRRRAPRAGSSTGSRRCARSGRCRRCGSAASSAATASSSAPPSGRRSRSSPTSTRSPRRGRRGRWSTATSSAGSARSTTRAASSPACSPRAPWSAAGEDLDALGVAFAFPRRRGARRQRLAHRRARARARCARSRSRRPACGSGSAESGDIDAWVHVSGRSAHGALTDDGENAIHAAVALIAALPRLGLDAHTHPLLGRLAGGGRGDPRRHRLQHRPRPLQLPAPDPDRPGPGRRRRRSRRSRRWRPSTGRTVEVVEMTEPFETPADSPLGHRAGRADRARSPAGPRSRSASRPGPTPTTWSTSAAPRRSSTGPGDFSGRPPARGAHRRQRGRRVRRGLRPRGAAGAQLG